MISNFKLQRRKKLLSLSKLSEKTQIPKEKLKDYENLKLVPSEKEIEIISYALNINSDHLLETNSLSFFHKNAKIISLLFLVFTILLAVIDCRLEYSSKTLPLVMFLFA